MSRAPPGQEFDVIVLGGGMAGATVAAHLAGKRRVALLEREPLLAQHTTGRSAAMFLPSYGGPAARPLTRASRGFFLSPPRGFDAPLFTCRAALHIARREHLGRLEALAVELPAARALTAAEARGRVPILRPGAVAGALMETDAGDLDVARLHAGFVRATREAGGLVAAGLGEMVIERCGGRWRARAGEVSFVAPVLVNAAGAWGDLVAQAAGVAPLGLSPLRRTAVLVAPPDAPEFAAWPIVKDVDERYYFRPFSGRLLVTPCDETPSPPCDAQPEEIDIAHAMARFEAAADHAVRRIEHRWAGLRTFAPDRAPMIGWAEDAPGFFWQVGLGGIGIQTAPAAGRLAAALIVGEPLPAALTDFGVTAAAYAPARRRSAAAAPRDGAGSR